MLRLSKKTDYAIVALSHLYETKLPASVREIADSYHLSSQMLANVLKMLSSTGVLISKRGVTGGYSLGKSAENIFLGEVIDIIDGPIQLSDCTSNDNGCRAEDSCPAKAPIIKIHQRIKSYIDNLSLADIAGKNIGSIAIN